MYQYHHITVNSELRQKEFMDGRKLKEEKRRAKRKVPDIDENHENDEN